jgi:hypothetical protein
MFKGDSLNAQWQQSFTATRGADAIIATINPWDGKDGCFGGLCRRGFVCSSFDIRRMNDNTKYVQKQDNGENPDRS